MTKVPEPRFTQSQVVRAAYRAAGGATAAEIAAELKITTARVFRLLRQHGLQLIDRNREHAVFGPVRITRTAMGEFERVCEPYGVDPQIIAARVLEEAGKDSARLREIVKELAEEAAKEAANPRAPRGRSAKSETAEAAE
jgi:DNA-binding CsgD family transcriptional regulator